MRNALARPYRPCGACGLTGVMRCSVGERGLPGFFRNEAGLNPTGYPSLPSNFISAFARVIGSVSLQPGLRDADQVKGFRSEDRSLGCWAAASADKANQLCFHVSGYRSHFRAVAHRCNW